MKRILTLLLLIMATTAVSAQQQKGKLFMGPSIGYAFGGFSYGAGAEYAVHDNWNVGIDVGLTKFNIETGYSTYTYTYSYSLFGILAGVSYHFLPKNNFDPYVKVGVGYFAWNASVTDQNGNEIANSSSLSFAYSSGIGLGAQAGLRYHITDNISARVAVGWPFYASVGADFALQL